MQLSGRTPPARSPASIKALSTLHDCPFSAVLADFNRLAAVHGNSVISYGKMSPSNLVFQQLIEAVNEVSARAGGRGSPAKAGVLLRYQDGGSNSG